MSRNDWIVYAYQRRRMLRGMKIHDIEALAKVRFIRPKEQKAFIAGYTGGQ